MMVEFSIASEAICVEDYKREFSCDSAGAFVDFEGRVRKVNEGKAVVSLEYEVFEELALSEGLKIIEEAKQAFNIIHVRAVHRQGHLQIGDCAVWVGVLSMHRSEAFSACRYMIDEIKKRLPIWKKEYYLDHPVEWVSCQHSHVSFSRASYYSKQVGAVSVLGQEKLKSARILIVGLGGLGCPAASSLATAGVGNMTLCDGDRLELSNLHRQTLFSVDDLGHYKALLAARRLEGMNPFCKLTPVCENLSSQNIKELIQNQDLVLDCTDNFESQFLLHDACLTLNKPFVQASIYAGTGLIQAFPNFKTACLRCLWPQIPENEHLKSCIEPGVLGAQTAIIGSIQALQAINILSSNSSETLNFSLYVDLSDFSITKIHRTKNIQCPFHSCHSGMETLNLLESSIHSNSLDSSEKIIDLQDDDLSILEIMKEAEKDPSQKIFIKCKHGIRSRLLVEDLHSQGFRNIFNFNEKNGEHKLGC